MGLSVEVLALPEYDYTRSLCLRAYGYSRIARSAQGIALRCSRWLSPTHNILRKKVILPETRISVLPAGLFPFRSYGDRRA